MPSLEAAQEDSILVTGFDASEQGLCALQSGQPAANMDLQPEMQAQVAMQPMVYHLEQEDSIPPMVLLENTEVLSSGLRR